MRRNKYTLKSSEKILLEYITKGMSNREIAEKIHVSYHTVKSHLTVLYKKFNVPNRCSAAYFAAKHNLINFHE